MYRLGLIPLPSLDLIQSRPGKYVLHKCEDHKGFLSQVIEMPGDLGAQGV